MEQYEGFKGDNFNIHFPQFSKKEDLFNSEGKLNIDELHIDLIDRVNPFQKAFEVLSKSVTTRVLKVIQDTIESTRILVSEEEALITWPKIKAFRATNGVEPSLQSNDALERRMAEVLIYLKDQKRKQMAAAGAGQ